MSALSQILTTNYEKLFAFVSQRHIEATAHVGKEANFRKLTFVRHTSAAVTLSLFHGSHRKPARRTGYFFL